MNILVTGATGYIGGRLIPILLENGHQVRILAREAQRVQGRDWAERVAIHEGDLTKPETLDGLCDGIEVAYYLVHSMGSGSNFHALDMKAARNFVSAAKGVQHVVYLGGLLPKSKNVSKHLMSRAQVGRLLRKSLPATEFRAGPIIGSGSASFEMTRYLTERLPVMITPSWIRNKVQPIGIRDLLNYLVSSLDHGPAGVVDIGANVLTFLQMMMQFAEVRGLKRRIYPTPILAPSLASRWVGLVTPLSNNLARPLIEGIVTPVLADTRKAERLFPKIKPMPYMEAVRRALLRIQTADVKTRWSGALGPGPTFRLSEKEGMVFEERSLFVPRPPEEVARGFMTIGGERGWLVWRWAWWIRGFLDILFGGPGLRRGRRHPEKLLPGEALDFWRVEVADPPRLLRLRAEMKVPGRAWLQWETIPEKNGTRLIQTALFAPRGFLGFAYWYSLYPFHQFIFSDLIRAVANVKK